MMTPMRYVLLVLGIIVGLHYILSFTHEEYGKATSVSRLTGYIAGSGTPHGETAGSGAPHRETVPEQYYKPPELVYTPDRKANATFVMLVRNSDLPGIMSSMKQIEDRFNRKFNYPYVLLNDEPFTENFKKHISALTDAEVEFGLIPKEHWIQPPWIDESKASAARQDMVNQNVIYGGSVPYRNMCRFNSGFFYRQELLQKYKYYWRVEPDVKFFCDVDYDPFLLMQDQQKVYGFTISLYEYPATIPTLWQQVRAFINENPDFIPADSAMAFLSDDGGESYNRCHFWSNFEIGDMDFWREEAYSKFFEHLDQQGGFYYERWGDAPVHSIGAALFARKDQIHFFNDIGYRHEPFQHCPQGDLHSKSKCWCDTDQNFDYEWYSCLSKYDGLFRVLFPMK